jgi:hypothetical protein
VSASSPFRTETDANYRWPPEPGEIEREYVRVTKLINAGEPQPWMKPWVSKLIAEEAVRMSVEERDSDYDYRYWFEQTRLGFVLKDADAKKENDRRLAGDSTSRLLKCDYTTTWDAMSSAEKVAKYVKETPDRKRDLAANKGTAVHKLVENIELGLDVIVPAELQPYVDNFRRFRKDFPITYTDIEATVYSDTYGYAGQCDAFAEYDGKTIILDYKTGESGIKTSIALQLAAYAGADFIGREDGSKDDVPAFDEFWGVSIRADGYDVIPVAVTDETFNYFLGVRETALWMAKKKSEVLGKALKPLVVA